MKIQRSSLKDKKILLCITGSVAAYKAVDLTRRLRDEEASVSVIMTDASCRFITPLSLELASGRKVYSGIFDDPLAHIELAREADVMLVAPATANTIAKLAQGLADDLVSASFLAFKGPVLIAPAMNENMYEHPVHQRNLDYLKQLGVVEIPPCEGPLACGITGKGRMAELPDIIEALRTVLSPKDMQGMKVVVTSGPTREQMDPVRFISNRSSGRMGHSLAAVARRRGADVVLISGPSALDSPYGVQFRDVESAAEMRDAVLEEIVDADVLVMAAAVADFRPASVHGTKMAKSDVGEALELEPTVDILAEAATLKSHPVLVGFSAETGANIDRAEKKMRKKGADLMVFNDVTEPGAGFEVHTNKVVIISTEGRRDFPLMDKEDVAQVVLDSAVDLALRRRKG